MDFIAFSFYLIGDRVFLVFTAASAKLAGLATAGDFLISVPKPCRKTVIIDVYCLASLNMDLRI